MVVRFEKGIWVVNNMNILGILSKIWFKVCNEIILRKNRVHHENFHIKGYLRIYRENPTIKRLPKHSISIGKDFGCNSGLRYNPIGGDTCTILRTIDNGTITIGKNVGVSNVTLVARNKIDIEDDVVIGGGVKIYDNDFHSIDYYTRVYLPYDDISAEPVRICKGVFIGAGSYVLKGVTIGENSVIGAGSVISRNIPSGEIWAGNPARLVRKI